jgi:hypothetical protein
VGRWGEQRVVSAGDCLVARCAGFEQQPALVLLRRWYIRDPSSSLETGLHVLHWFARRAITSRLLRFLHKQVVWFWEAGPPAWALPEERGAEPPETPEQDAEEAHLAQDGPTFS